MGVHWYWKVSVYHKKGVHFGLKSQFFHEKEGNFKIGEQGWVPLFPVSEGAGPLPLWCSPSLAVLQASAVQSQWNWSREEWGYHFLNFTQNFSLLSFVWEWKAFLVGKWEEKKGGGVVAHVAFLWAIVSVNTNYNVQWISVFLTLPPSPLKSNHLCMTSKKSMNIRYNYDNY